VAPGSDECFDHNDAIESLRLHWKNVPASIRAFVDGLSTERPGADEEWAYVKRWLEDAAAYDAFEFDGVIEMSGMLPGDLEIMCADNAVELLPPGAPVRGSVKMFTRPEHLGTPKARRRQLGWPRLQNMHLGRETLRYNHHVPKHILRRAVKQGTYGIEIDFSQYFTTFELSEEVRNFYVFRDPTTGALYRCCRLAMGCRQASMIASCQTVRICDVPLPAGVEVHTCTDNIRVTGDRVDAQAVMKLIIERALHCGLTINEDTSDLDALTKSRYAFLGEFYDHDAETMCSTDKSMRKVRATWARRDSWSHRQWAAFQGIMLYCSSTQRVPIFDHQIGLRFMRETAVALERDASLWDAPMPPLTAAVLEAYAAWFDIVDKNIPVSIVPAPGAATHIYMSDASRIGWSAIVWAVEEGTCSVLQELDWGTEFDDVRARRSANAEPEAVYRALCRTLPIDTNAKVLFYTDHQGFMFANEKGFSTRSEFYNETLSRIYHTFPNITIEMRHVRGIENIVDAWSRGASTADFDEAAVLAELRAYAKNVSLTDAVPAPFARPLIRGGGLAAASGSGVPVPPFVI
jgi:hypothetical protein